MGRDIYLQTKRMAVIEEGNVVLSQRKGDGVLASVIDGGIIVARVDVIETQCVCADIVGDIG